MSLSDLDEEGSLAAADVTYGSSSGSAGPRGGQEGQQVGGHVTAQHARDADIFNKHRHTDTE
jgi:nicotinamide mononucleotide (NMN) deamidase PncC